jgi:hypothetical protein
MTRIPSSTLEEKLAGKPCDSGNVEDAPPVAEMMGSQIQNGGRKILSLQNGALLRGLSVASGSLIIAAAIIQTNTSKPVEDPWLKALLLTTSICLGFFSGKISGKISWSKEKDR